MLIVDENANVKRELSSEEIQMLETLKDLPAEPDEDCPEMTEEQLQQFRRISEIKREERRKQSVTIRLSPQALQTAKSLGKGYTSILGRILENALRDAETIKQYL